MEMTLNSNFMEMQNEEMTNIDGGYDFWGNVASGGGALLGNVICPGIGGFIGGVAGAALYHYMTK